jgi:hypothetical protein
MEFDAVVEAARGGGALVTLPGNAAAIFGTRARRPVVAWFNDVEYRGSTMPRGDGLSCVGISKAVRAAAGVDIGDPVHVRIELDDTPRSTDVPSDLAAALARAGLTAPFESLLHPPQGVRPVGGWGQASRNPGPPDRTDRRQAGRGPSGLSDLAGVGVAYHPGNRPSAPAAPPGRPAAYSRSTMALANSDVLTSVAPSIWRAKS